MSSSAAPPIRAPQFDHAQAGGVDDSVNLFRGDVNLTQSLFTLPGRFDGQGLDVEVSLLYSSNVIGQADVWNRDAPTGTVGMGWSPPLTSITLESSGAGAVSRSYAYAGDPLIRELDTPFLFALSAATAAPAVGPVPASLVSAFAERGLALDSGATLAAAGDRWTIDDDALQQQFTLRPRDGGWAVHDGGEAFQRKSYQFWKILYYPRWERWAVTDPAGVVSSFGGSAAVGSGPRSSRGNSVEWAVGWTSPTGALRWSGASQVTEGQRQYGRAWCLESRTSLWGDVVRFSYDVVEQAVGSGGLPYTKACYLASITDVFGRTARFTYAEKLWSDDDGSPREYCDPHRAIPSDEPGAYQDRYETRYLQAVAVHDTQGAAIFSIDLTYSVANVTTSSGRLRGDTYKRFLTSLVFRNADGDAQPPLQFDYDLDPSSGGNRGALRSMTSMEGVVRTWSYQRQELDLCQRSVVVRRPSTFSSNSQPRVWFGSDYAVALWYDSTRDQLALEVLAWYGRWISWLPSSGPIIHSGDLDLSSLEVVAAEGYFAVTFSSSDARQILLYARDTARPGQWFAATVHDPELTPIAQPLSYSTKSAAVTVVAGTSFLVVGQMDDVAGTYVYDRLTWRWTSRTWTREAALPTLDGGYNFITASGESCCFVTPAGNAQVQTLDAALVWRDGPTARIPRFSAGSDYDRVALVPGNSMVVISKLTQATSTQQKYSLFVVPWDASDTLLPGSASFDYVDQLSVNPTSWVPQIVDDTLIAVGGHLLRFDGRDWQRNDNLAVPMPASGSSQRYAYGPDVAVQVYVDVNDNATAQVLGFDPEADANAGWSGVEPQAPVQRLTKPSSHAQLANWPSIGGDDFLTIGQYLYFRGSEVDWGTVVRSTTPGDLLSTVRASLGEAGFTNTASYVLDTRSVIDQSPQFLTYGAYDGVATNTDLSVVPLVENGQVIAAATVLDGEVVITGAESDYGQPGVTPSGLDTFVTYPPNPQQTFSAASSFTLRRFAGDAVDGKIVHYAVTGFTATDGFGAVTSSLIVPDPAQATCDSEGRVVKYYQTTVAPGAATLADLPAGRIVTTYLNGLDLVAGDYYGVLDGLTSRVEVYGAAGELVSRTDNQYEAHPQRCPDPAASEGHAVNLYGAFVCQTGVTTQVEGVTQIQSRCYRAAGFAAPWSTQPLSSTTSAIGASGAMEIDESVTRYACQLGLGGALGDAIRALHLLAPPSQGTSRWSVAGGTPLVTSAAARTAVLWPSARGPGVTVPAAEATFAWRGGGDAAFPFAAYEPGASVTGWRTGKRALVYSDRGVPIESLDAQGAPISLLTSADGAHDVARVFNASLARGQWTYLGFEPYERTAGWSFAADRLISGDGYAGVTSLALAPGAALSTAVTPAAGVRYLLGYALKTPAGFSAADGTGWSITVSSAGVALSTQRVRFADTDGGWRFFTCGIEVPDGNDGAITVAASNGGTESVQIDDVFLIPLVSDLTVITYGSVGRAIATMDARGTVTRTVRDRFGMDVGQVDGEGRIAQLTHDFASRAGSTNGAFDPTSPNAQVAAAFAGGGVLDTFDHGAAWTKRWQAGDPSSWSIVAGALRHAAGTTGTLAWSGELPPSAALTLDVRPDQAVTGAISVQLGAGNQVSWTAGAGWACVLDGNRVDALATPPAMAHQWLLIFGRGQFLCFGDGQLLFSHPWSGGVPAAPVIDVGSNAVSVRNLGLLADPRVQVAYADAAGLRRQSHALCGADAMIIATVSDALGNTLAQTKPVPASFGDRAVLAYDPDVVDYAEFRAATATTWAMTGLAADYYRGQDEGHGVTRSDDQGYPYVGTRFFASPTTRPCESGLPGLAYAIHDVEQPPSSRATTSYHYGCNGDETPGLAPGSFGFQRTTGPTGRATVRYETATQQIVGNATYDAGGVLTAQLRQRRGFGQLDTKQGPLVVGTGTTLLPDHFESSPPSGFTGDALVDALGQQISSADSAGAGAYTAVYDACGRVRFIVQPATGAAAYLRYDPLGRCLEQGTLAGTWSAELLATHADDPAWPGVGTEHTVARAATFDGDGSDPTCVGRTTSVRTTTASPADDASQPPCTVTESYTYDRRGRTTSVGLAFSIDGPPAGTVRNSYNEVGEIVRVDYPEGSPLASAWYTWDDCGRLAAIGTAAGTADLAGYQYTAAGEPFVETRGAALTITRQVDSPGWVGHIAAAPSAGGEPVWSLDYQYNPDATVATRTETSASGPRPGTTVVTYAYDGRGQLSSAVAVGANPGTEGLTTVDASGNVLAALHDDQAATFTLAPASDQIESYTLGGQPPVAPVYDAAGFITQAGDLGVSYDPFLLRPSGLSRGDTHVRLAYGAASSRALKQVSGPAPSMQAYFCGPSTRPLAIWKDGTWTALVYGPFGVTAVQRDQLYFPLEDVQQSVRLVIDTHNQVVAQYDYGAFGHPRLADGADPGVVPLRYMGQEWDAEAGVYNFKARLYSPDLRRFLSPDPSRQYPSPYVFVGNQPVSTVDPTGEMSAGAALLVSGAIMATGFVLGLFSGGLTTELALDLDVIVLADEGGADLATLIRREGGPTRRLRTWVGKKLGRTVDETRPLRATEKLRMKNPNDLMWVDNRRSLTPTPSPAEAKRSVGKRTAQHFIASTAGQIGTSTGYRAGMYSLTSAYRGDFSGQGFAANLAAGAFYGFLGGCLGGLVTMPQMRHDLGRRNWSPLEIAIGVTIGKAITTAIASDCTQALVDGVTRQRPTLVGFLSNTASGLVVGAGFTAATEVAWGVGISPALSRGLDKVGDRVSDFIARTAIGIGLSAEPLESEVLSMEQIRVAATRSVGSRR